MYGCACYYVLCYVSYLTAQYNYHASDEILFFRVNCYEIDLLIVDKCFSKAINSNHAPSPSFNFSSLLLILTHVLTYV